VTSEGRRRTKTSRKILSSPENSLSFPVRHRRAKTKMGQYKRVRFINCLAPHKVHVLKKSRSAISRYCQERWGGFLFYESIGTSQELNIFVLPQSVRSVFPVATAPRKPKGEDYVISGLAETKRGISCPLDILAWLIITFPPQKEREGSKSLLSLSLFCSAPGWLVWELPCFFNGPLRHFHRVPPILHPHMLGCFPGSIPQPCF